MRRLKNWLRNTMTQKWSNYAMLLSVHNESTDKSDFIDLTVNIKQNILHHTL